ncbi:MAG: SRPBCC family protein [Phycisphaerales bacterium]
MPGNTIHLHRILKAPPARVFKALLDPDAMARWSPPYGFLGKVHHIDPKVGGTCRMSFINFGTGSAHSFTGTYTEITPNQRLRYTERFDDPNMTAEMAVTINLRQVLCGTEITIEQAGLPEAIPPEMCHLGWQESLTQLANLVEPEIPDGP